MDLVVLMVAGPVAEVGSSAAFSSDFWVGFAKEYADSASAIISFLAVAIALLSMRGQQRHNKLSVVPLPDIRFRDMEDRVRVEVVNNGNGPMVFLDLEVVRAGEVVANTLIEAMPKEVHDWTFFIGPADGRSIRAGDSVVLIEREFSAGPRETDALQKVRKALGDLNIRVRYTDIYGSRPKWYEKSLKWFKRML